MSTIGYTSDLSYSANGTDYTALATVRSYSFASVSTTSIETTVLNTANRCKTFQPGLIDAGSFSAVLDYDKAVFEVLEGWVAAGTTMYWRLALTDGSKQEFQAFLTSGPICETVENEVLLEINFEAKITGAVSFTPSA
jgi:hypothetical protein